MQWLLFAVLAIFSMVTFRRRIYERMRRKLPAMKQGARRKKTVVLPTELQPGEICRLEYCGSSWNAVNGGKTAICRRPARATLIGSMA